MIHKDLENHMVLPYADDDPIDIPEDKEYIKGEDPVYDEWMDDMRKTLIDIGTTRVE